METTEPMEESSPVASASLKQGKAESDPAEDIEESGDEVEESGDEEYVDSEDENEAPVSKALAHYYAFLAKREAGLVEESGYSVDESSDEEKETSDEEKETVAEYTYSGDTLVMIRPKWWVEPEWDVDSFDGVEYDSSEEHDAMSDEELERDWRRFKRQFTESKGFYVEPELMPMYNYSRYRAVDDLERSANSDQTYRDYFAERACTCLKTYNQYKGLNVEFVDVVRGAFTGGPKSKSYIT